MWGRVDRKHNAIICAWLGRPDVLDLGCGYGTLSHMVAGGHGLRCVGVDHDAGALEIARHGASGARFVRAEAADLPFADGHFGTIVLRDSLHHLVNDPAWPRIADELRRVSRGDARLIVLDPNVNGIVRAARTVVGHQDEECEFEDALATVKSIGWKPVHVSFNTLFTLPLSGGYVGPELVPDAERLHRAALSLESAIERRLARRPGARRLAWRYLIVADRCAATGAGGDN